jgi:threonine dehydratase
MIPTEESILEAVQRLAPYLHQTPVLTSSFFDQEFEAELFFKCENFQKTGAFKARGATNAVLKLPAKQSAKGVCTHSSGNHGQALAWAAKQAGIKCYVVVPENAPEIKIKAMRGYGAELTLCAPTLEAREAGLQKIVTETGAHFIPPFNHYDVVEGQATAAYELLQTQPDLDILIAPVGGGGLLSGTALSTRFFSDKAITLGAEPEIADDAYRSLKKGELIKQTNTATIADGLRTSLGPKTFGIIQAQVEEIMLTPEDAIVSAMRDIWERMKIVIEPSCAVPLAAMRQNKKRFKGKKVGIILTGGNVDLSRLPFD